MVEALARRKAGRFSRLYCDVLRQHAENGHVMRNVVTAYARAVDEELAAWIEQHVTFPSTMVDRIVRQLPQRHWTKLNTSLAYATRQVWHVSRSVSGLSKITLSPVALNGRRQVRSWWEMSFRLNR
ncbi:hypothetical protein ACNKHK_09905 [Shigella flexneri]